MTAKHQIYDGAGALLQGQGGMQLDERFLIWREREREKKREREREERIKTNFPGREILIKPFMSKLGFHNITH